MTSGEETLVREILSGDVDAYALLVKRYQKPIFNLMWRMTGSEQDAVDLTQETFVRAYEKPAWTITLPNQSDPKS